MLVVFNYVCRTNPITSFTENILLTRLSHANPMQIQCKYMNNALQHNVSKMVGLTVNQRVAGSSPAEGARETLQNKPCKVFFICTLLQKNYLRT